MRIAACTVNHIVNPLGFCLGDPTFAWTVEEATGSRAQASRLVVSDGGQVVADTGWTDLDSLGCRLGLTLTPRTRYEWQVSVRSDAGEEATSDAQWFETGKLGEPWQARWLTCDSQEERHPVFFRDLPLSGEVAQARAYVCGLGLYELRVNGVPASEERLAPGTCAYDRWLQVGTYDITQQLQDGSLVEVALGNGWYKGRFGFDPGRGGWYGDNWELICELRVRYADGREEVFGTDVDWQVRRSNVTFSNLYDGERRDDTLSELPVVAATLLDERRAQEQTDKLEDRWSLPVMPQEEFDVTLVTTPAGECVFDCGQNLAGTFRLRVHEPRGTVVRVQMGEVLQEGNFYRDNLRSARAEYVYVSDGAEHVLEPRFTYFGYRYAKVEGLAQPDAADFVAVATYSAFPSDTGRVVTGHAGVNRLVENARWGMRSNFVDTATDCPQRDERMGWTGDAQVFSPAALLLGAPAAFFAKYLHDMAHEQDKFAGMVPLVVPAFMLGGTTGVWGDASCIIPWNVYRATGDVSVLERQIDHMAAWVDYVERVDGDDHGWGRTHQLGDWLALDNYLPGKEERKGGTDEGYIAYAFYLNSARIVAKAARVLGRTDMADHYDRLADRVLAWIRSEWFSPNGRCCVDTQTAQVVNLAFGLMDEARAAERLVELIRLNGDRLSTGFVGTAFLCDVLSEAGHSRVAYDLLLNEDFPGWLYAVNHGATTIWERWNSLDEQGRISGTGMNSLNHYAYGEVVEWIFAHAAGLRSDAPGYRSAVVAPEPSWRLRTLEMTLESAVGMWRVAWRCVDERRLRVEIVVPFGATAQVRLPFADEAAYQALGGRELSAGSYQVEYETTEPLRRVPCADWTLRELVASADTRSVIARHVRHVDMLPPETLDLALREALPLLSQGVPGTRELSEDAAERLDAELRALAE